MRVPDWAQQVGLVPEHLSQFERIWASAVGDFGHSFVADFLAASLAAEPSAASDPNHDKYQFSLCNC